MGEKETYFSTDRNVISTKWQILIVAISLKYKMAARTLTQLRTH